MVGNNGDDLRRRLFSCLDSVFSDASYPLEWVQYLVQTFFQGVALPILAFVAKKEGSWTRKILTKIFNEIMAAVKLIMEEIKLIKEEEIKELLKIAKEERSELKEILQKLGCGLNEINL